MGYLFGLFFLVLMMPLSALAEDTYLGTGNDFLRTCHTAELDSSSRSALDDQYAVLCAGYIDGYLDAMRIAREFSASAALICLPDNGIETGQAIKIILKDIREHPENSHVSTRIIALRAMANAFRCPANEPTTAKR